MAESVRRSLQASAGSPSVRRSRAERLLGLLARCLEPDSGVSIELAGLPTGDREVRARVVFVSPDAVARALWPPTADSIADAYVRGDLEIEGDIACVAAAGNSFDLGHLGRRERLTALGELLLLRGRARGAPPSGRVARLAGAPHSVGRDRAAVRFHYDAGNAFYALWLDRRMTYSCAYFATPDEPLDSAQEAKLDLVCRKLGLREGQRLLDIGCGWGSLIVYATERYGVEAVGVTLSSEQAEYANAEIRRRGLRDRARALVLDYRELGGLGRFDAVASIGMFEHVGRARLRDYFVAAWNALRPGGRFLNHGIAEGHEVRGRQQQGADFVARRVFPDGELVPIDVAIAAARSAAFEVIDVESLRPHYALTLAAWVRRLEAARDAAISTAGHEVYRTWRLYMAGSRVGFETGRLDVLQALFSRPTSDGPAGRPLRPWWRG